MSAVRGTWRWSAESLGLLTGLLAGPLYVAAALRTSPLIGGVLLAGSIVVGLAIYSPYLAVVLTAAVVPLERIGRFSNDSQMITFSLMRTLGLLGTASLALNWCLKRHKLWIPMPVVVYACYALIGALTLSFTDDFTRGVQQTTTNVGNVLFLLLIVNVVRDKKMVLLPITLWLITTAGIGAYSIYEWHTSSAIVRVDRYDNSGYRTTDERFSTVMEDYGEFETIGAVKRVLGSTSSPAVYGINVILTLPFYMYFLRTTRKNWIRVAAVAGLGIGAYNVILTNTRAAVAALVFCGVCMFLSRLVKFKRLVLATGVLAAVSSIPFLPQALSDRLFKLDSWSTQKSATLNIRLVYWSTSVDIFADNPWLGIGIGNQNELPRRLSNTHMPANTSAHNEYIETLLETGIIGYPFMAGFLIIMFRRLRSTELAFRAENDEETELFLTAIRMGFLTILFYALQCDVLHFTLKGFWLSVGLTLALWNFSRERAPVTSPASNRGHHIEGAVQPA